MYGDIHSTYGNIQPASKVPTFAEGCAIALFKFLIIIDSQMIEQINLVQDDVF